MSTQPRVAPYVANVWREIEAILIVITPVGLLGGSLIAAIDRMSNGELSINVSWLVLAFAIAKAVGVTFWPAIAVERARIGLRAHKNIFWWGVLIAALGLVDVQIAVQFGFLNAHMTGWGWMSWLNVTGLEWLGEQSVLGYVLVLVGKAIVEDEQKPTQPTQPTSSPIVGVPPLVQTLYLPTAPDWTPPTPLMLTDERPAKTQRENGVTGHTPQDTRKQPNGSRRRGDSGSKSADRENAIAQLVTLLRRDRKMSLTEIVDRLGISRPTAVTYRREAWKILAAEEEKGEKGGEPDHKDTV